MSRISEDNRTASQELAVVLKWTVITVVIIGVIGIGTFLWAATNIAHVY